MIDRIKEYVDSSEFEINIFNNKVHVLNYKNVISFDDNLILLNVNKKVLSIKGNSIVISKLLDNEILVMGEIDKIEIR